MDFNSPLVQWALKWGLSKSGVVVTAVVTFIITHLGLSAFIPADNLKDIQTGLDAGGQALFAIIYVWLVHRNQMNATVLKTQINVGRIDARRRGENAGTLPVDTTTPVGNNTLQAVAVLTGVSVERATNAIAAHP
jgi:hypothetical protein